MFKTVSVLILGCLLLGSCKDNVLTSNKSSSIQDGFDNEASLGITLVDGVFRFPGDIQPTSCQEYLESSLYADQGDGLYWIDPDGEGPVAEFQASCDMTSCGGGGWTLVLNYLHRRGVNTALDVRTSNLPLMGSSTLGTDESTPENADFWGHAGNALMSAFNFTEVRYMCRSSATHGRQMNFYTADPNTVSYYSGGAGSVDVANYRSSSVTCDGHNANLPSQAFNIFTNQNDLAMTNFPFWRSGNFHWGVRGLNSRWECDDFARNTTDTHHQIWIRN